MEVTETWGARVLDVANGGMVQKSNVNHILAILANFMELSIGAKDI